MLCSLETVVVTVVVAHLHVAYTHRYHGDPVVNDDGINPDCIFDQIKPDNVPQSIVRYVLDHMEDRQTKISFSNRKREIYFPWWKNGRLRRETEWPPVYRPIRIIPFFVRLGEELSSSEQERLKNVVHAAIQKIKKTLSVIPVKGPLLLERNGCRTKWRSGQNMGKCAQIAKNYRGEMCSGEVKIPDEHLSGLYTWSISGPATEHYGRGAGIPRADFVLYVRSFTSTNCVSGVRQLIAYASYCQLDQNDRPIAGYVTFCPQQLQSPNFSERKSYLTAMHEMFHALGFAKDMFNKFRDCSKPGGCVVRSSVIGVYAGVERLLTPAVIKQTQQHFDCPTEQDFGAPLEIKNELPSSHWHPRFLQGSLMAPTIGVGNVTFLDSITLSAFEDSGWYKVDYTQADDYTWGKGEGCKFGLPTTCETDEDYFCTGSDVGCHYTHLTKGHCDTDVDLTPCRIYMARRDSNCSLPSADISLNHLNMSGQVHSHASRCFVANLTNTTDDEMSSMATAGCYLYFCSGVNSLLVRTKHTDWQQCPFDTDITVPGFAGYLHCPKQGVLCTESDFTTQSPTQVSTRVTVQSDELFMSTSTPYIQTTVTSSCQPYDSADILPLAVVFSTLSLDVLEGREMITMFVEAVIAFIVLVTRIREERIQNVHVKGDSVHLLFDILPAHNNNEGPSANDVYTILQQHVNHGNFTIQLTTLGRLYADNILIRSVHDKPMRHSSRKVSAGAIAGIIIGAVTLLLIVAMIIIAINKYKLSPSAVNPPPTRTGNTETSSTNVVYTHSPERVGLSTDKTKPKTPKRVSFTDLEEVVTPGCGDR